MASGVSESAGPLPPRLAEADARGGSGSASEARHALANWVADVTVLRGALLVQGSFLVLVLLLAYVLYLAGDMVTSATAPGYYARQAMLAMGILGKLALVVVGAALGALDVQWGTWGTRVTAYSAVRLTATRWGLLLVLSVAAALAALAIGEILDFAVSLNSRSLDTVGQLLVVSADVALWVSIGFAVATLTRSLAASAGGVVIYLLAEMFLESRLPQGVLACLPNWNASVLLAHAFPVEDGAIGVVLAHHGPVWSSALVCSLYGVVSALVAVLGARREL